MQTVRSSVLHRVPGWWIISRWWSWWSSISRISSACWRNPAQSVLQRIALFFKTGGKRPEYKQKEKYFLKVMLSMRHHFFGCWEYLAKQQRFLLRQIWCAAKKTIFCYFTRINCDTFQNADAIMSEEKEEMSNENTGTKNISVFAFSSDGRYFWCRFCGCFFRRLSRRLSCLSGRRRWLAAIPR